MTSRVLFLVGGVLLGIGLVLGFVPVSAGGASCGSAFVASDAAQVSDYATVLSGGSLGDAHAAGDCSASRSTWRVLSLALSVPGLLVLGGGAVVLGREREGVAG